MVGVFVGEKEGRREGRFVMGQEHSLSYTFIGAGSGFLTGGGARQDLTPGVVATSG